MDDVEDDEKSSKKMNLLHSVKKFIWDTLFITSGLKYLYLSKYNSGQRSIEMHI